MRDYTLAARTNAELQALQKSFISVLISSIAAKSKGNQGHAALYAYTIISLAYHVRAAVSVPLASDGLIGSLLFHDDPSVVAQVLAGVSRSDVDELAAHFEQVGSESGYWSAARIYHAVASIMAGLGFV